MENTNNLLSRKQAAQYLGIKEQTLAAWACTKRYNLSFIKIGRRAMYQQCVLDAFIKSNIVGGNF